MSDFNWLDEYLKENPKEAKGKRNIVLPLRPEEEPEYVAPEEPSTLSGLRTGLSEGLSFGFMDELLGGVGAGIGLITGDDKSMADNYTDIRDAIRKQDELNREASPVASTIGEIGGSIGSSLAAGVGAGAALGKYAPTIASKLPVAGFKNLGSIAKMAGVGAVEGGLYSAGKSESGVGSKDFNEDVLAGTALGGVIPAGLGGVYKGVTRGIPQVARIQALAGLTKEQANLYGDYLEDIGKFAKDSEAFDAVIDNMKAIKSKLSEVKKDAGKLYNASAKEIVPEADKAFLAKFNERLAAENLGKVNTIDDLIPKLDNKGSVNLFNKIKTSLGDTGGLKRVVSGKEVHTLRKEADDLIKWDRKSALTPTEERTVKAARNALKDIASPSVKSGDAFFKAAGSYKAIQNKLIDKNGKPTGFLNRLEEGKLKQSELDWVTSNFNSLGETLKNAVYEASDAGLDMKIVYELEDFANALLKQDTTGTELINKIYKFKEFQRTGSLRDISKLVKVGGASVLGSPLMGVAVAMTDTPASVLKQILQIKKGKDAIIKAPIKLIGDIKEAKASAPIREYEASRKAFNDQWSGLSDDIKEATKADNFGSLKNPSMVNKVKEIDSLRTNMLNLEEPYVGALDDVADIRAKTDKSAQKLVDTVDATVTGSVKELPRAAAKVGAPINEPFNWEAFEEDKPQPKEVFNWNEYEEDIAVEPTPVVDKRFEDYKRMMKAIKPNYSDEEIEANYNKYSGKSKAKMNETNSKFGVK